MRQFIFLFLVVSSIFTAPGLAQETELFWAESEFRGFEKSGVVELPLRRFGNTNEELTVTIEISPAAVAGGSMLDLGSFDEVVVFESGQAETFVEVRLQNDHWREGRERFAVQATVTNTNVMVTRGVAELVVLDDETTGTLSPERLYEQGAVLHKFAMQPDGKLLLVTGATTLWRMNPDGTRDETFVTNGIPALPGDWAIWNVQPQADGKIYVGGRFHTTNGFGINHLARLNADGTLDASFDPALSPLSNASNPGDGILFDVFEDGKVIVYVRGSIQRQGGGFAEVMFRLKADGTIDRGGYGASTMLDTGDLVALSNGEVIAYTDRFSNNIRRFGTNGIAAAAFLVQVPSSAGFVYDMEVMGEALLIGGSFQQANSLAVSNLARIDLITGVVDTNFVARLDGEVTSVRAREGKIYIVGAFTTVNGVTRPRVARLNADGSVDLSFDPGLGINHRPGQIEVESDGKVLVGVNFNAVDGVETPPLVRLEGDSDAVPPLIAPVVEILWPTNGLDIQMTDAWYHLEVRVRASDVDGTVTNVLVELDGVAIHTNSAREFTFMHPMPSFAEHTLKVTATDNSGAATSETVAFKVTNHAQGKIEVQRDREAVVIGYTGGRLVASADLRTWVEVHAGGGEYRAGAGEPHLFFRVVSP